MAKICSNQHALFELVPFHEIGVHLNDSGVMEPLKSVSGLIGTGPGLTLGRVPSLCSTCNRALDCRSRRNAVGGIA